MKLIREEKERLVAIAGNPNVGKSTIFNSLTGMHQHTGNWPGKTVESARGTYTYGGRTYTLVDIPGAYSLLAHSAEEEVARNFLCFGEPEVVIVVCDATCLERNMNLALQTMEICKQVVLCVNLMDEAERNGLCLDLPRLSGRLGIPVVGVTGRKKKTLTSLLEAVGELVGQGEGARGSLRRKELRSEESRGGIVPYPGEVEAAIGQIVPVLEQKCLKALNPRWLSLRLLEQDAAFLGEVDRYLDYPLSRDEEVGAALERAGAELERKGIDRSGFQDLLVSGLIRRAEEVCGGIVRKREDGTERSRRIDRILTSRRFGYPLMALLLAFVFWLTIVGANYPSELLSKALFRLQDGLTALFVRANAPEWLHGMLVLGVYRVLSWVVSVMLPPMAIFFPIFTLLEDCGYLPRVAFNLDKSFQRCRACGKQALTTCMGFGCNAAGVVGCRIIDSPRERLIAMLTNSFVPCNGRFPAMITLISLFLVGSGIAAPYASLLSAVMLTGIILLGLAMTFLVSRLLSSTVLKGVPSSFTLELPPYRRPQVGKVIVRSIFDRTLFVLGRAVSVAAPAGLVIFVLANTRVRDGTLLFHLSGFLDPFARQFGLDGVILLSFLLGLPANEIVIPLMIMAYSSAGSLMDLSPAGIHQLFVQNGWTWVTAVSTLLFFLMHWPCATTCLTIKKESGSLKWTLLAIILPTAAGLAVCFVFSRAAGLFLS